MWKPRQSARTTNIRQMKKKRQKNPVKLCTCQAPFTHQETTKLWGVYPSPGLFWFGVDEVRYMDMLDTRFGSLFSVGLNISNLKKRTAGILQTLMKDS